MPPPIQTYYDGSPEEQEDLLELRKAYYETLRKLELQAARFGGAVPSNIAADIADAKANIRAIDEARAGTVSTETAEKLGSTGQFAVLVQRIDLISQQVRLVQKQADEWRDAQAAVQEQAEDWRTQFRSGLDALADIQRTYEKQADKWRAELGSGLKSLADTQHTFQRTTRMIVTAIGIILALLSLALMGLAAALWSLR